MKIAALFDLDGVLIDTEGQYSAFWASVGKDYFPDVEDFSERLKGQSLQHIYDEYFEGKEELREEIRRRLDAFEYTMRYVWVAGAKDFVKSLRRAGIGVAVVTSSNREKMKHLYDACPDFASLFDHILTAEDSSVSKPVQIVTLMRCAVWMSLQVIVWFLRIRSTACGRAELPERKL